MLGLGLSQKWILRILYPLECSVVFRQVRWLSNDRIAFMWQSCLLLWHFCRIEWLFSTRFIGTCSSQTRHVLHKRQLFWINIFRNIRGNHLGFLFANNYLFTSRISHEWASILSAVLNLKKLRDLNRKRQLVDIALGMQQRYLTSIFFFRCRSGFSLTGVHYLYT
jgi:hypothetical protein